MCNFRHHLPVVNSSHLIATAVLLQMWDCLEDGSLVWNFHWSEREKEETPVVPGLAIWFNACFLTHQQCVNSTTPVPKVSAYGNGHLGQVLIHGGRSVEMRKKYVTVDVEQHRWDLSTNILDRI